jgi:hypothetical protein
VLGIIGGTAYIPKRWSDPVGKAIKLHKFTGKFNSPATLEELTDRTMSLTAHYLAEESKTVALGSKTRLPADLLSMLYRSEEARAALQQDVRSAVVADGDLDITFHYNGDPVMRAGIARRVSVSCRKNGAPVEGKMTLGLSPGWKAVAAGKAAFDVTASEVKAHNTISVRVGLGRRTYSGQFTFLGPDAAKGFPSATNIETCPTCRGRKGTCICPKP